ncbi:MAG: S-layer homology domain-containing protein, partial [Bacillota bacterium]|nr:S-layer homology domain-containing protein [Bacillota bacterium]
NFFVKVSGLSIGWYGLTCKDIDELKATSSAIAGVSLGYLDAKGAIKSLNVTTDDEGKAEIKFTSEGKYTVVAYGKDADNLPVIMTVNNVEVKKSTPTSKKINITVQSGEALFMNPQFNVEVASDLAESYGYTDQIHSNKVSALDALVKAHVAQYGGSFTAQTAKNYLVVSDAGYVTKLFGYEPSANGFFVNGGYPNDGTESQYGGYNGTTVNSTELNANDFVEFYIYQDQTYWSDIYSFVDVSLPPAKGNNYVISEPITVTVTGISAMGGYLYKTSADMKASAEAISGASIGYYKTNKSITDLKVKTNKDGVANISFPSTGEYHIVAYKKDDNGTPIIMSCATVNVKLNQIKLTAPKDADVKFYKQDANFKVKNITLDENAYDQKIISGDSIIYALRSTTSYSNYEFRVSQSGKLTHAGYLSNGQSQTIDALETYNPAVSSSAVAYDDASVLLNINSKNKLELKASGYSSKFKLRAYRAAWEIINTSTANVMVEPDFHYSILTGNDVISIGAIQTSDAGEEYCNGNATNNWLSIEAKSNGAAIVSVYYDAIKISGSGFDGIYSATDPAREGVFVVTVGNTPHLNWNYVCSDGSWDSEFDTVYYVGDKGEFVISPSAYGITVNSVTVQNVSNHAIGIEQTVAREENGSYIVPVIEGANVICAHTSSGDDYMVVRARKISYRITNVTTSVSAINSAPAISTGDTVSIEFIPKLDMPIPKLSGIYNPGYLGTAKTAYVLNDKYVIKSAGTQYDFALSSKNSISFIAHVEGENKLNGYIDLSSMGSDFGDHRNAITDSGKAANLNAVEVFGQFGVLPDINFTVTKGEDAGGQYETALSVKSLEVYSGPSSYSTAFLWKTLKNDSGSWGTNASNGISPLNAKVSTNDDLNSIEFKYWYEGEPANVVSLQNDTRKTIDDFKVDVSKILNIEITVTSYDKTKSIKYSYVVIGGKENLKYVHPIIRTMTINDEGGNSLTLKHGNETELDYITTQYALDCKNSKSISINASQLQKYTNSSNNTQDRSDTVVVQKYKNGKAVSNAYTVLPKTEDRYPVGSWALQSLPITDADEIRIIVTSYVNSSIKREYSIKLSNVGTESQSEPQSGSSDISVTFQLIGCDTASSDVDLGNSSYLPEYRSWINTKTYTISKGSTVKDLLYEALEDYGYTYSGDDDYISGIKPSTGTMLSEFTNGSYSGWMYTVNGSHPQLAMNQKTLKNGDKVIWHYVNDYRYEVSDWSSGSMGDGTYFNGWLKVNAGTPTGGGTSGGSTGGGSSTSVQSNTTAKDGVAETSISVSDMNKALNDAIKAESDSIVVAPEVKGSATDVKVELPTSVLKNVVDKTDATVAVQTPNGSVAIPTDALKKVLEQAGNQNIAINVETKEVKDVQSSLVSNMTLVLKYVPEKADGTKFDTADLTNASVVDFSITAGKTNVSTFGGESVTVAVPVGPKHAEGKMYRTFIISSDGTVEATYAKVAGGSANVEMKHFSTVVVSTEECTPFFDVELSSWYKNAVIKAFDKGIANGVGEGCFAPTYAITRSMFITMLYKLDGQPTALGSTPFVDVEDGSWYADAVRWAYVNEIVNGVDLIHYDPASYITREQMGTMLYKYARYKKYELNNVSDLVEFGDVKSISNWALDAIKWANGNKILNGTYNMMNPKNTATRAEAAQMLVNFVDKFVK